jgi:hypothetical protein
MELESASQCAPAGRAKERSMPILGMHADLDTGSAH